MKRAVVNLVLFACVVIVAGGSGVLLSIVVPWTFQHPVALGIAIWCGVGTVTVLMLGAVAEVARRR